MFSTRCNVFVFFIVSIFFLSQIDVVLSAEAGNLQKPLIPDTEMGRYKLPDSSLYEGPVKFGLFHGIGKLTWRNGSVYEGEFVKGRMSGPATLKTSTGDVYKGEFQDGLEHGKGKWVYKSGDQYEGEFVDGVFQGKGVFVTKNGDRYESDFVEGRSTGEGSITLYNGNHYVGEIRDWHFHGEGKYEQFGKETYEGGFENGYFHGKGALNRSDGSQYIGEFKNGLFDGSGEYHDVRGKIYRGQFVKGMQKGHGKIEYTGGDHYEGETDNWQPHGVGTYKEKNGNQYIGGFVESRYEGEGEFTYKNGDRYVGEFKNGYYHGKGKFIYKNPMGRKQSYEGEWEDGALVSKNGEQIKKQNNKRDKYFVEESLIKQGPLLGAALNEIEDGEPNHPELYFISFGAYSGQEVFMMEALFSEDLFEKQFDARGKSISLINNRKTSEKVPMATVGNLKRSLNRIGEKMNIDEDILFLFITSHGSKEYGVSVNLGGMYLHDLKSPELAGMLKESGIKWKVIVVSACYSGSFIDDLKDDYTMVMTSSRADHVSFGCSDEADFTFFGRAYFEKSVAVSASFKSAFEKAEKLVYKWENEKGYSHSEPQFASTEAIERQLRRWRGAMTDKRILLKADDHLRKAKKNEK